MKNKITTFEAYLKDQWVSWQAKEDVELKLIGRVMNINFKNDTGAYVTRVNLDLVPAYTINA